MMPARPPNVVFLTGPADLMVFVAGLAQLGEDIRDWAIVVMGRRSNVPPEMIEICRLMAGDRAVDFLDFGVPGAVSSLLGRMGRRFDSVAVSHIVGGQEEALLGTLRWDRLILTENGIATHILPDGRARSLGPGGQPRFAPDIAVLPLSGHPRLGPPAYLRNLPGLRILGHDRETYRQVLARLRASRARTGRMPRDDENLHAVVAGTSLSRLGVIPAAAEARIYHRRLARLTEAAAETGGKVLWKPHPRLAVPVAFDTLPHAERVVTMMEPWPLEMSLPPPRSGRPSVHSIASTCLLSADLWHDLATWRIPARLKVDRHRHLAFLCGLPAGGPVREPPHAT